MFKFNKRQLILVLLVSGVCWATSISIPKYVDVTPGGRYVPIGVYYPRLVIQGHVTDEQGRLVDEQGKIVTVFVPEAGYHQRVYYVVTEVGKDVYERRVIYNVVGLYGNRFLDVQKMRKERLIVTDDTEINPSRMLWPYGYPWEG